MRSSRPPHVRTAEAPARSQAGGWPGRFISTLASLGLPAEDLAAFTCPACYVRPWQDLVPTGMAAVRWARIDAGRLVAHHEIAYERDG